MTRRRGRRRTSQEPYDYEYSENDIVGMKHNDASSHYKFWLGKIVELGTGSRRGEYLIWYMDAAMDYGTYTYCRLLGKEPQTDWMFTESVQCSVPMTKQKKLAKRSETLVKQFVKRWVQAEDENCEFARMWSLAMIRGVTSVTSKYISMFDTQYHVLLHQYSLACVSTQDLVSVSMVKRRKMSPVRGPLHRALPGVVEDVQNIIRGYCGIRTTVEVRIQGLGFGTLDYTATTHWTIREVLELDRVLTGQTTGSSPRLCYRLNKQAVEEIGEYFFRNNIRLTRHFCRLPNIRLWRLRAKWPQPAEGTKEMKAVKADVWAAQRRAASTLLMSDSDWTKEKVQETH